MEAFGIYILKASGILALFWGTYLLFLRRETHFGLNRAYLLTGLLAALLLPLVRIPREVILKVRPGFQATGNALIPQAAAEGIWSWTDILMAGYLTGTGICLFLLGRELWQLRQLLRSNPGIRREGFIFVPTEATEAPFSFFRYIFYNPDRHAETELPLILEHEKAHSAQYHSLDILLGRLVASLLWINPLSWRYQKSIRQNLEYLADAIAVRHIPSRRAYQYTLLRVSGNPLTPALTTSFYSSLIKKRIVMLNTHPSKTIHKVKHLLILPILALFLMAFAREDVYVIESPAAEAIGMPAEAQKQTQAEKVMEVTIDRETTDAKLMDIKTKLAKDGIDFSYTVARNAEGEIISLEFDFKGKAANGKPFSGAYASDSDGPIQPTLIRIDDAGGFYFGEAERVEKSGYSFFSEDAAGKENAQVWVFDSDQGEKEIIEIRKEDGKNIITVDGQEMDAEELASAGMAKKIVVRLKEIEGDEGNNVQDIRIHKIKVEDDDSRETITELHPATSKGHVMIMKGDDGDTDIEVVKEPGSFFFIGSGGDADALYYIDGKKVKAKKVRGLDPDKIDSIEVLQGESAIEKYGKKAENGVILITTKKEY